MKIVNLPSPNFNERPCAVDSIIIHYTDMTSTDETLKWLCNPNSKVSAHYLIDEEGQITQLVDEDKRAWHAGESYWQGRHDMNSCSIGIELVNPGHSFGYRSFPDTQIDSLMSLCERTLSKWNIPPGRILGHSDIAPQRKQDPGHLFPWERLAREGMGLWPTDHPESSSRGRRSLTKQSTFESDGLPRWDFVPPRNDAINITELLNQIGYETTSLTDTIIAFQRHFQQHKVDGIPDDETYALIQGLLRVQEKLI